MPQRVLHGAKMIANATTPYAALLLLALIAVALRDPVQRWLLGLIVLPIGLIWAVGFSYDLRNLAMIVPFVGTAAGAGLMFIPSFLAETLRAKGPADRPAKGDALADVSAFQRFGRPNGPTVLAQGKWMGRWPDGLQKDTLVSQGCALRWKNRRPLGPHGLLALIIVVALLCMPDRWLLDHQHQQQRLVGIPALNRELYAFAATHADASIIATDYQAMPWLPELSARSVRCTCDRLSGFRATYDRPDVRYALVWYSGAVPEVRDYLDNHHGDSPARLVFETRGYRLYEKVKPDRDNPAIARHEFRQRQ